jgi:hypothetical protein
MSCVAQTRMLQRSSLVGLVAHHAGLSCRETRDSTPPAAARLRALSPGQKGIDRGGPVLGIWSTVLAIGVLLVSGLVRVFFQSDMAKHCAVSGSEARLQETT